MSSAKSSAEQSSSATFDGRSSQSCEHFIPCTGQVSNTSAEVITTWYPNMETFSDPSALMDWLEELGAHKTGICKVIPQLEWRPHCPSGFDEILEKLKIPIIEQGIEITDEDPNVSYITSCKSKTTTKYSAFIKYTRQKLSNQQNPNPSKQIDPDDIQGIEDIFWKDCSNEKIKGWYGADVQGSLMDKNLKVMNFNKLNGFLQNELLPDMKIDGIHNSYLYFGSRKTFFGTDIEDINLHSMNFCHMGWKLWFGVYVEDMRKLEEAARAHFPCLHASCAAFLRHKAMIFHKKFFEQHGIRYVVVRIYNNDKINVKFMS